MKKTGNPMLIRFLESKVELLLSTPPEPGAPREEMLRHNQRIRQARLTLARAKGTHTSAEWAEIVAETGGICVRCGYQHNLEYERPCKSYIVPLSDGGSSAIDNLQPLCRSCATAKGHEHVNWLASWRAQKALDEARANG